MTRDDEQFDDLPDELIDALKSADKPVTIITARADRAILAEAEAQFSKRRQTRRRLYPAWAAVAAAVLVAVFLVRLDAPDTPAFDEMYADHDGSGQIDIADVLHVARAAGATEQADLDAFALRVVSLSASGGTP